MTGLCHKKSFANGSFMAINMVLLDDEHGFSLGYKKALHFHIRLSWLHSGLRNRVSHEGGFNRIWLFVLRYLNFGNKTSPD
jgi:hypothetical protein